MIGISNKDISTMITLIGMIAFLVVRLEIGYALDSGATGASAEFPKNSEYRNRSLYIQSNNWFGCSWS